MKNSPKKTYDAFRASMMAKSDAWKDLLAENVKLTGPLAQVEGKASFIAVNTPFFQSIVDSKIHQMIESDDYILTRISTSVAMPSGKVITLEVSEWYEIKDNLLQSLIVYFDTAEFIKELGE